MPRNWPKYWLCSGLVALIFAGTGLFPIPTSAQSYARAASDKARVSTAPSRPRITVYPRHRHLGPNAKRYCRFWLAKEYRVSGTVITPQQRCWWD